MSLTQGDWNEAMLGPEVAPEDFPVHVDRQYKQMVASTDGRVERISDSSLLGEHTESAGAVVFEKPLALMKQNF